MQPSNQREPLPLPAADHRPNRPRFAKETLSTGSGIAKLTPPSQLTKTTKARFVRAFDHYGAASESGSKGDRPRLSSHNVFIQPGRVKISAVGPCKNPQFNSNLCEVVRVGECSKNPCIHSATDGRAISHPAFAITKRHRQPMARQYRNGLDTPRRGGRYSNGSIFRGCCLAWHRFQSSTNSERCAIAHSTVRLRARRGSDPAITSSVRMSIKASCSPYRA